MLEETTDARSATPVARELRDHVRVLRRYWVGELVVFLVVIALTATWTALQPRVYESTAAALTQAAAGDDLSLAFAGESLAKSRAESYVRLATSNAVAQEAAEILGSDASIAHLLGRVDAKLPNDTAIIEITARAESPEGAAALADAWIEALASQVAQLESPEGSLVSPAISLVPLSTARVPSIPASPNIQVAFTLGALAGMLLAVLYGILRHHFDRRIRTAAQIESLLRVPVIGTVPISDALTDRKRIVEHEDEENVQELFNVAESLRELRTNLNYIDVDKPPNVLVVTSSLPGEGKSTLTANLADAIASSGRNVVIIDCDLRRPTQSDLFNLRGGVGLSDVLSGRVSLQDALQTPSQNQYLRVLAAGRRPPNPSEMLGSNTMRELVDSLSSVALVLLDAPPLLPVTDAAIMSTIADGVLVTVGARQVTAEQLAKASQSVTRVNGRVLGAVLNKVPLSGADAADYGYYRYGYYGEEESGAAAKSGSAEKTGAAENSAPRPRSASRS